MRYDFSIHSPLAGRDGGAAGAVLRGGLFNPLAPCGARPAIPGGGGHQRGVFNPLAPCGARRIVLKCQAGCDTFSIHSPLAGRDGARSAESGRICTFQSTRPLRGETNTVKDRLRYAISFSIHSPLAGRDNGLPGVFQGGQRFSIHSPLAGRDRGHGSGAVRGPHVFNPLAPCGARPDASHPVGWVGGFSIHSPLAGRDLRVSSISRQLKFSIHSPLAGRDPPGQIKKVLDEFSIHSPLAGRD